MAEETNQNQAPEVVPTVAGKNVPSTDEPVATNIPSANAPDPKAAKEDAAPPKAEKPAAAKKEKAPAVEDKPFVEFIQQDYLPAVQKAIAQQGIQDLQVSFAKQKIGIRGFESPEEWWQVIGSWQNGLFNFNLYFPEEDIQGKKGFSCSEGKKPSTLESFLIDERRITLDLLVFGLVQRLNGQKWLGRN